MSRPLFVAPPWLAHALRAQRGPVPWSAVVRGGVAAGPLLLAAVLAGQASVGVVAAIAAMLAGINDRPGGRRAAVRRMGVPAVAGAGGLLVGTYGGENTGAVGLTLLLTFVGLLAGGVSAVGPVASGAGTQLLVASAIGAGMPLPEPGWQRALAFLGGAGWLLVLRLVLPSPGSFAGDFRFDGERDAVASVYAAIADLLDAVGTDGATARRVALTAALDHAQDTLAGPRLRRYASSAAERRLHAQYAAALPLAEAATALAWAGESVPARAAEGPRRLASAVRANTPTGPLPAPSRSAAALRALDDALLHAAEAFDRAEGWDDRAEGGDDLHIRRRSVSRAVRTVFGAGGREYGLRVALCFGAGSAVAQALYHSHWYGQHTHWYWLPATAVFLVKPDLGPLVSRVVCRAAGTVLGALLFAGFAAVLPRPEGLIALVAVCGALIPVATRHFAAQTAVVTLLVLALVMVGGEPQASVSRIGETMLACAIVLVAGHLPMPGQRGGGVLARLGAAERAAQAYLAHVLNEASGTSSRTGLLTARRGADGGAVRLALRRETDGIGGGTGSLVPGCEADGVDSGAARLVPRREADGVDTRAARLVPGCEADGVDSGAVGLSLRREADGVGMRMFRLALRRGAGGASRQTFRMAVRRGADGVGMRMFRSVPGCEAEGADSGAARLVPRSEADGVDSGAVRRGADGVGTRMFPSVPGREANGVGSRDPRQAPRHDADPVGSRAARWTLRREAYRTLAEARVAIVLAAAELPPLARHSAGTEEVAGALERLVDTTTACAVQLDDSGRLAPRYAQQLAGALDELAVLRRV